MTVRVPRSAAHSGRRPRAFPRRWHRWLNGAVMAGHGAAAWICGLLVAGWLTHDLAAANLQPHALLRVALVVVLVLAVSNVLSALYSRRYQRGSLDEVIAVAVAVGGTALVLAVLGIWLIPGQRAPLVTVAGAALFALPAILGARYLGFTSSTALPRRLRIVCEGHYLRSRSCGQRARPAAERPARLRVQACSGA